MNKSQRDNLQFWMDRANRFADVDPKESKYNRAKAQSIVTLWCNKRQISTEAQARIIFGDMYDALVFEGYKFGNLEVA